MQILLLSGGSGKRLWPLSDDNRSKQFLPLLGDERGGRTSMLQRVWAQLCRMKMENNCLIATSRQQEALVREQVGRDVPIVVEPERKDTFAAVALSVTYMYGVMGLSRDEDIVVLPVDSFADDAFYDMLPALPDALRQRKANMALIGKEPGGPAEKFGYILPVVQTEEEGSVQRVSEFKEKPSATEAAEYIRQGALWNCGVFCFTVGYMLDKLSHVGLPSGFESFLRVFPMLQPINFDKAVLEHEKNAIVMPYRGAWEDLGTWCSITQKMGGAPIGQAIVSADCANVHVINETAAPAIVMGLSDAVVVVGNNGILVADKKSSSGLKESVTALEAAYPARSEAAPSIERDRQLSRRRKEGVSGKIEGGWSRTLDRWHTEDTVTVTKRFRLVAGETAHGTLHPGDTVLWRILDGEAFVFSRNNVHSGKRGTVLSLNEAGDYEVKAAERLDAIEIRTMAVGSLEGGRQLPVD